MQVVEIPENHLLYLDNFVRRYYNNYVSLALN